ncbi:MAG: hypothetical protein IJF69_06305 [Clostridia bacterium]|nr:hypothetical protein [Clostridia bacterium]
MKKVLALILTAAMLLSCMIVGISAVREHATNVETTVTTDKAATNSAHFSGLRYNDPYYTDNYTFSITMKSCTADFGQMAENTGFCDGVPIINMINGTIGWNGQSATVAYEFADNTWYTIEYVVDGNTTIYVNGAEAGVIDAAMPGNFYGSFYASYVTEIYYKQGSDYALYEDFEDGNDSVFSTDVTTFEDVQTSVSYENYNVTYSEFGAATNSANFCGLRYNDPYATDNYTATFVMKSCTADFGKMAENTGFCDGVPIINMINGTIGWNNGPSVAYTFADDTWYTIEYVVDGNTTVKVNGEVVGTIDAAMPGNLYGSFYNSYVKSVSYVSADGDVLLQSDYTDGADEIFSTDLSYFTEVGNKYDLGMKYWMFDANNAYVYATGAANADSISLDMILEDAEAGFRASYFGDGIVFGNDFIGVGGATISYEFKTGVWYHLEYVDAGDDVAIYVDDVYVGSVAVAAIAPSGICGSGILVGIDNFAVNGDVEDFEDGKFNKFNYDGNGVSYDYNFDPVKEETIFDLLPAPGFEGTAYLLENSWDGTSNYVEQGNLGNLGDHYIVDYNIAILPTNDSADGNFFEIWTNWNAGSPVRWKVGTEFAGKDDDLIQFDWGEATLDNFHRVTLEFKNNRGYMYIDGVEVYNGLCGSYKDLSIMIMMPWNASIVLDDFAIYNGDLELIKDYSDLRSGSVGNNVAKWVNLDAADFCDENGCVTGKTTMEYDSTCYSLGNNQTWCAVCGALKDNREIALKDHVWAGYDINRTTETGLVYTYCKNAGCVETRYTELPKKYNGKLYQFYDMQDDMVLVVGDEKAVDTYSGLDKYLTDTDGVVHECWQVVDGALEFKGQAVYDEFWGIESAKMPVNDWSVSYDFFLDESKHWTNEDGGVDYECFFIRCCGNAGYQLQVGWDRINEQLFIRKTDGSKVLATCDYSFEDLTTYNFKVASKYEGYGYTHENPDFDAPWYAEISIWIDGEKVLSYGDTTGEDLYSIYDIAYGTDLGAYHKFPTFGQFGTSYTIDNLAFGSYDFEIIVVLGDVDGDGELTANDALMMRKYLAGVISADDFINAKLADMNADGALNAKDQLLIRKALVA